MKNKIVSALILTTGVLYTAALLTNVEFPLSGLAFITGVSAIMTSLLIKEKANGKVG